MTDEPTAAEEGPSQKEFSIVRKGYDPAEVQEYLDEYDVALRDLEEYAARLKHDLAEAKAEISRLQAAEQDSVDKAMLAVFDAKERIMERARQKAQEIEEEARVAAGLPPSDPSAVTIDEEEEDLDLIAGVNPSGVQFVAKPAVDPGAGVPDATQSDSDVAITPAPQPVANTVTPAPQPVANTVTPAPQPAEPVPTAAAPAPDPSSGPGDDILRQMLSEADTIKAQLEAGMSAAIEEMERMQADAEARAAELLDEARQEAIRLRSTGTESKLVGTTLEVTLPAESDTEEKRSRYSKTSAKLPRLGNEDGTSVLASMNQLRNKLRETEQAERAKQQESNAS